MILSLQKKEQIVFEIDKIVKVSLSAVVASLDGITVDEVTKLRKEARSMGVYIFVVRNTLMRRIIQNTSFECLKDIFVGSNIVAFSIDKIVNSALVFVNFLKDHEKFKIKGAAFEGKFVTAAQVKLLSTLPDYNGAVSKLIAVMRVGGVGKLMYVLHTLSDRGV